MSDLKKVRGNTTTLPEPAMATTPLQALRGEERRRWESTWWKRDWGGLDSSLEQDRRNPEKRGEYDEVVVVDDLGPETWDTRDVDTIAIATGSSSTVVVHFLYPFEQKPLCLCFIFILFFFMTTKIPTVSRVNSFSFSRSIWRLYIRRSILWQG